MLTRGFATIAAFLLAGMAQAVPVLTTSGATGVVVNDKTYNVDFEGGSCIAVFDGCDDMSDFTFQSLTDATAASEALLALIDDTDSIDRDPRVAGCSAGSVCHLFTPFFSIKSQGHWVDYVAVVNQSGSSADSIDNGLDSISTDISGELGATWAMWSEVSTVPLPASAPLLIAGMAGLAALGRRRQRKAS